MLTFMDGGKTWKQEIDDTNLIIEEVGDKYFTWKGCNNCNDEKGVAYGCEVYDVRVYPNMEYFKRKNEDMYWEKRLCEKCIYEYHYGKG